ncbi:MAG TPA: hypothetical protein VJ124_08600 [Pyrinomonadaceae bacterium]|nr:hypothetical protein [Pyrinomonadaceae bacterium]
MKNKVATKLMRLAVFAMGLALFAGVAQAQQSSVSANGTAKKDSTDSGVTAPVEAGETAGDYTVISSIEVGYRGLRVDGDVNKYKSDLNYKAGPRLFDTSFLLRSTDGKSGLFETFLVTSSGWGADPQGQMRISVEKSKWFRFDGSYRRFKYYRFLNNFANPNWIFSGGFTRPPDPVTGEHGYNTYQKLGDFDLTILPKNERIKFYLGYSPERYSGPAFTNYHAGGNEFMLLSELRSRANDFRVGADARIGPIDLSFLQGFRRFRDDSVIDLGPTSGLNANPAVARLTSFVRNEPSRGSVNYTRFSAHTLLARKLDMTARLVYSSATNDFGVIETISARNWNPRSGSTYNPPNILTQGTYNFAGNAKRPNTLADFGVTYLATDNFRLSNTFRVETFQINGSDFYTTAFFFTRTNGTALPPLLATDLGTTKITKYRKIQDTVEGDYQFNNHYSVHFGYRYGSRHIEEFLTGFNPGALVPARLTTESELEDNHTNAFFGGFKARPLSNWTIYFDAERGTADNVFTRIGNYDHTNIRAKTRYAPSRNFSFNLAIITRDNSNPSEIAGVSLEDFGVSTKSRVFTSSFDWLVVPKLSIGAGYNYNWINSDAVIDFSYLSSSNSARRGHSVYYMRNNFFFFDAVARLFPRATLYASYRINKDNGQGQRRSNPTGNPAVLVTSYPLNYQSPEARLAIKINRRLDWNIGYQYYNYNESVLVGPRPQNYHAHLPYTSLRIYFGRRE